MSLDTIVHDWSHDLGFDAKSLATLPWNLIPYSFVVDWFANVSDYIGGVAQAFYPKSLGQCHVHETVKTEVRTSSSMSSLTSTVTLSSPSLSEARQDTVYKARFPGLPSPHLIVKTDFRLDDLTRISDAFALVGQQIARRFLR
jgi:hypothetical protein